MARIGGSWRNPAAAPTRVATMVSERQFTAAHGDVPGGDSTLCISSFASDNRTRSSFQRRSDPWDPGDGSVHFKDRALELQRDTLEEQHHSIEGYRAVHLQKNRSISSSACPFYTKMDLKMEGMSSPWITHVNVRPHSYRDNHEKELRNDHLMLARMVKRSNTVSSLFLDFVRRLLYEIPEDVIRTPRIVGRLMSILKHVKQRSTVDDYISCFFEVARVVVEFVALFDYNLEDVFLVMMFVVGLKKEIRYDVQILNPKSLSEAILFARIQENELQFQQEQPHIPRQRSGHVLQERNKTNHRGTSVVVQSPYHCKGSKGHMFDETPERILPHWDEEARSHATRELMRCIVDHRMTASSVVSCVRDAIINQCNRAEQWLREKSQLQDSVMRWAEPVLWSSEIRGITIALDTTCESIWRHHLQSLHLAGATSPHSKTDDIGDANVEDEVIQEGVRPNVKEKEHMYSADILDLEDDEDGVVLKNNLDNTKKNMGDSDSNSEIENEEVDGASVWDEYNENDLCENEMLVCNVESTEVFADKGQALQVALLGEVFDPGGTINNDVAGEFETSESGTLESLKKDLDYRSGYEANVANHTSINKDEKSVSHLGLDNPVEWGSVKGKALKAGWQYLDTRNVLIKRACSMEIVGFVDYVVKTNDWKETTEAYRDKSISDAVISVPAYLNDAHRNATKDAGRTDGNEVQRTINALIATALSCDMNNNEGFMTVLELGERTIDDSILEIFNCVFEVKVKSCDTFLGEEDSEVTVRVLGLVSNMNLDDQLQEQTTTIAMSCSRTVDAEHMLHLLCFCFCQ